MSDAKRQHYVPQVLLRRFATKTEGLTVVDRRQWTRRPSTVNKSAAEKYLYSPSVDGVRDYGVERWLSDVEDVLRVVLDEIMENRVWPLSPDLRKALLQYICLQWSRSPTTRVVHNNLADHFYKGTVEEKGFTWFSDIMSDMPRLSSVEDMRAAWERIKHLDLEPFRYEIPWDRVMSQALDHAEILMDRQATLYECEDWSLLTSDRGVGILPGVVEAGAAEISLLNADAIFFPIARNLVVVVGNAQGEEMALVGSVSLTKLSNMCVAICADQWLFHHPDDVPLLGLDVRGLPKFNPTPKSFRPGK